MTVTAVVLILVSAFSHAGWNLLSKNERPSVAFMLVANTLGTLCLAPVLVIWRQALAAVPTRVWLLLVGAGIFQTIYFAGLAGAYRTGDLSIAYPLARAVPVVVVALINLAWGRGAQLTGRALAGMALVVVGSLLLPRQRFDEWHLRHYLQLSPALALVAALGTSGYSIVDDAALRQLRAMDAVDAGAVAVTLVYACLEGFSTSLFLAPVVLARQHGRDALSEVLRVRLGRACLAGLGIHFTYTLVLVAMGHVTNVSYVVAFRQLSIPLGAVLGVLLLGEPGYRPKVAGVALMSGGLILVALG
jgi:drug/metabolite transporter (DMT)-like permease